MQAQQLPLALELSLLHFHPNDLVVGKANEAAFGLLRGWPYWRTPTTVLIGAAGSGKSHMAALWSNRAKAQSFDHREIEDALTHLEMGRPLLIENIRPGEFSETALFHLLNAVTQAQLEHQTATLLLTSRFHPSAWDIRLADLASRLKAVQLAEIFPPDDALLMGVLTKLFADRQLLVESHLIHYCISRMERSLETAIRFVAAIDRLALEKKSKVTRSLALQALNRL